jgi:transcriptional regulator with XRE-family HTH domain
VKPVMVDRNRQTSSLGQAIRRNRRGRYTVEELATRAGISNSLVSQIENGRGNPSFITLLKLAQALELPMTAFFDSDPRPQSKMIVRKAERRKLMLEREKLVYELLTPDFNHSISFMQWQIPPGWDNQKNPFDHQGEECVHVLSGSIEGHVDDRDFILYEGDTVTYDADLPHWWRNATRKKAVLLLVGTPPSNDAMGVR